MLFEALANSVRRNVFSGVGGARILSCAVKGRK